MYNTLSGFDAGAGDNMGSVCSFIYVPKEWLTSDVTVNKVSGAVEVPLTLLAGKAWLNGECVYKTNEYSEKDKGDKPGNFMEATLAGTVLKVDADRHRNMITHRYHEYVVIYKDGNGMRWIIGDKRKGMTFATDSTTGKQPSDAALYNISFVHQMVDPAPIYIAP